MGEIVGQGLKMGEKEQKWTKRGDGRRKSIIQEIKSGSRTKEAET